MNDNNLKEIHMKSQPLGCMFYLVDIIAAIACIIIGVWGLSTDPGEDYLVMGCLGLCVLGVIAILIAILAFVVEKTPTQSVSGKVIDKPNQNTCIIELTNGTTEQFISNKGIYLVVNDEGKFCIRGHAIVGFDGYRREQ
jgi:hypothetical protein